MALLPTRWQLPGAPDNEQPGGGHAGRTFSPEGAVILGEEGDTIYDWSTGLIFKRGRYFDPNTGIWLTMGGAMIWHHQPIRLSRCQRRQYSKQRRVYLLLLLLLIVLILTGCGDEDSTATPSDPTATCTWTPTPTPAENPNLPPPIVNTQPPQPPTPTTHTTNTYWHANTDKYTGTHGGFSIVGPIWDSGKWLLLELFFRRLCLWVASREPWWD